MNLFPITCRMLAIAARLLQPRCSVWERMARMSISSMKYCQMARAAGLFWSIPFTKSAPELETAVSLTGLMVLIISHLTLTICRAVKLNDHKISGQEHWLPLSQASISNTTITLLIVIIPATVFASCSEQSAASGTESNRQNLFTRAKGMLKNKAGWR